MVDLREVLRARAAVEPVAPVKPSRAVEKAAEYAERAALGVCVRLGCKSDPKPGCRLCAACIKRLNGCTAARVAAGLCAWCSEPSPDRRLCLPCRDKRNRKQREAYAAKHPIKKPQQCRRCLGDGHNTITCRAQLAGGAP
jgi:hypothetical protein